MSLLSPEQSTFVNQCRAKFAAGEVVTLDEMKRCIMILRGSRTAATEAASAKPRSTKKSPPTAEAVADALSDLDSF